MSEQAVLGISNEKKIFTEIMLGIHEEFEMQRKRHEKELEKENREKDELIKEQHRELIEKNKAIEEQDMKLQEKEYIIQLIEEGYSTVKAKEIASKKFAK